MTLKLKAFAAVLRSVISLPAPSRKHLLSILERGVRDDNNPYSLRAMADFLVGVAEYIDGAADLARRLADSAGGAASKQLTSSEGGTRDMVKKSKQAKDDEEDIDEDIDEDEDVPDDFDDTDLEDEEDEEDEEEEDEEEEEEEEGPRPRRRQSRSARKAKPKAKKPAPKRGRKPSTKKAKKPRHASVPAEARIPILLDALAKRKDAATINELFHAVTRTKSGVKLFPTRRSVKRVLVAHEDEEFARESRTLWRANAAFLRSAKKSQTEKGAKTKKGNAKKGKKGAAKKKK